VLTGNRMIEASDVPEFAVAVPEAEKVAVDPLNLENSEKELIRKALAECGNNRAAAARKLGISRRTLYRKLENMMAEE
jgi:transcriptional regulator with PAS, ATPase and Fis domain